MKTKLYHYLLAAVCLFAACKKGEQSKPATTKTTTAAPKADSISFTVNGSDYAIVTTPADGGMGWISTNNVEGFANGQFTFSDSKDTALVYNNFLISGANGQSVQVSFFKKFDVSGYPYGRSGFYNSEMPASDQVQLYATGEHTIAVDYMRRSNTDGVALAVSGIGATYSNKLLGQPSTITQSMENSSGFVVTSLTKIDTVGTGTRYLLKANFNAVLFNSNEQQVNLTNGKLSMYIYVQSTSNKN